VITVDWTSLMPSFYPPVPPRPVPRVARLVAVAALAVAWTVIGARTADAHVHVLSDTTTAGSSAALTFRVPNESDNAGTVKVTVQLPQDTPFLEVSTKPVTGWTVTGTEKPLPKPIVFEGTTVTKAVRTVTWTADRGTRIGPGEYQEFSLAVGPLPAAGTTLRLPVTQTYSDGAVVHWDQATPPGGEEPEHPAPELQVTAAQPGDTASPVPEGTSGTATGDQTRTDGLARGLAGAALLVAVAGLVVALVGRRRIRIGSVA
jgi:uncharacterized protein YcnI